MTNMLNPYDVLFEKLDAIEALLQRGSQPENNHAIYLKIDKASDFISTTENALRVMVHKGQIPFIKKHGKLFFLQSDLIGWLESGRFEPTDINAEEILINKKRS